MFARSYSRGAYALFFGCVASTGVAGCTSSAEGEPSAAALTLAQGKALACGPRHVSANQGSDVDAAGAPNECRLPEAPCRTIQRAADAACAGDEVAIGAGDYVENVVVRKALTLAGESRRTTRLRPAVSAPAPCENGTLCGGAASSVVLVQADHVTVRDLSIDGDNPSLTSGVVVGGADVDARNGIITNNLAGSFGDLRVERVRVINVYLRGIQIGNGGSFVFRGNVVRNVRGSGQSVAIFNFGGAGTIEGNLVFDANDAISSNHSRGTRMAGNGVHGSGSGLHTDNAGDAASSSPDRIEANAVTGCSPDGYGVWALLPYVAPTVRENLVLGCAVGLAAFGQGAPVAPAFTRNFVDGGRLKDSVGFYATNDQLGFGAGNARVAFSGNALRNNDFGAHLEQLAGFALAVELTCSAIVGNDTGVLASSAAGPLVGSSLRGNVIADSELVGVDATGLAEGPLDATGNFWGCFGGPGAQGCDDVAGDVATLPFLPFPVPCAGPAARAGEAGRAALDALVAEGHEEGLLIEHQTERAPQQADVGRPLSGQASSAPSRRRLGPASL